MSDGSDHPQLDDFLGTAPRRRRRHMVSIAVLVVVAIAALALAQRFLTGQQGPYYFAPVTRADLTPLISEHGTINGEGELVVRARVAGPVTALTIQPGDMVRFGQELARIDPSEAMLSRDADAATLTAADAELRAARVLAAQARAQLARFETVWKKSRGQVPSANEMATARAAAASADAQVNAAAAREKAARLRAKGSHDATAGASIRAPFAGIVATIATAGGRRVTPGTPLFTLARTGSRLTMAVPLAGELAASLKPGSAATVRLDDAPDTPLTASLTGIAPGPAGPKATFALADPEHRARAGMKATLEIELPVRRNALLVPNAALAFEPYATADRTRARIHLLDDDGAPARVYVTTGASDGKSTEIFAGGVQPGAQVIIGWRDPPPAR
ncbi:efflux RND transporter periplasmic adaptor subunit [Novosphingobium colocasiae]|uniref:efflux RND transporter periplasmic adaptor subunit n=1 Tax=Novosphingobium colocasiae TaxID=1256513 RepID=UPI0035B17B70